MEVASGFAPCLADETLGPVLLGESVYLTIPPHETVTKEWDTKLWLLQSYTVASAQDIGFTFFNEVEYTYYAEEFLDEIKIYPQPAATLSFPGNVKVTGARPGKIDKKTAYVIKDPTDIEVKATPTLEDGAFSYSLVACLCEAYEIAGYGTQYEILATGGEPVYLTTKGASHNFVGKINYPLMEANKLYYIVMAYEISEGLVAMTNVVSPYALFWDGTGSGIDGIEDDEVDADAPTEVYTLQGVYVGTSTEGLDHGIYIVRKGGKSVKVQI